MKLISKGGKYEAGAKPLRLWIPVVVLLLLCFVTMAVVAIRGIMRDRSRQADFSAMAESVHAAESAAAPSSSGTTGPDVSASVPILPSGEPTTEQTDKQILPQYADLYQQNSDLFGWVQIAGTVLDYPVMHSPYDPQKYLHHSFDGEYSSDGVPFMDGNCDMDSDNYILYGHSKDNGTMFRTIMQYADESFWKEHPVILFNTLYEPGEYEVMAAFYDRVYSVDDDCFKFYRFIKADDKDDFDYAVGQYKQKSLYDTHVTAEYGDQLITLVTCSYHEENGRFVVVARKRNG